MLRYHCTFHTRRDVLSAGPAYLESQSDKNSEVTVFELAGADTGGLLHDVVALLVRFVCLFVCLPVCLVAWCIALLVLFCLPVCYQRLLSSTCSCAA